MTYWRLFYHVVWATKNRLLLIEPEWESGLYTYLWGKATALECIPHAIGGMPDHLHIALSIPPKLPVARIVGQLKGASSHHINEKHTQGMLAWQIQYGAVSISEGHLETIVAYIRNQKQHHAAGTMVAELEHSPEGA